MIPVLELFMLYTYEGKFNNYSPPTAIQYVLVFGRTFVRLYLIYLIFSFYKRLERGESLLVEFGSRKLGRMID